MPLNLHLLTDNLCQQIVDLHILTSANKLIVEAATKKMLKIFLTHHGQPKKKFFLTNSKKFKVLLAHYWQSQKINIPWPIPANLKK